MWPRTVAGKCIFYVLLLIIFIIGLILLIPMPLAIFPAIISSQLVVNPTSNSTWGQLTNYWWKLPMTNHYDFVLWNITNPDEVNFFGAKAASIPIGPYSYLESEIKDSIIMKDDNNKVFFKNIKTWTYKQETSCKYCDWEDKFFLPNPSFMTVAKNIEQYKIKGVQKLLLEASLYLLGEYPVREVSQKGVLFLSYYDPLISFMNSDLMKFIISLGGPNVLGFPIPDIKHIGYFPLYNNTNDEDYLTYTGKDDAKKVGKIINWSNDTHLKWWKSEYANNLEGATDGTFNGAFIKDTDDVKIFQSFACRHFHMVNNGSQSINDIPTIRWKIDDDNFNPYIEKYKGYEYSNDENATYFPDWPCGESGIKHMGECDKIDCNQPQNFCYSCCKNQNIIGNKVKMPPGIIPLKCFPGLSKDMIFHATLSPHNFAYSPKEVQNSIIGVNANIDNDNLGYFDIQSTLGSTINAFFKLQLNIPIWNTNSLTQLYQHRSVMFPCFSLTVRVTLKDYALNFIRLVSKIAPLLILIIGIICVALPIFIMSLVFIASRKDNDSMEIRKKSKSKSSLQPENSIELVEELNYVDQINSDYLDL
uniref:CD36 family protein n=1 Tax=Strongyloides venezuelensis TaxID=75913 RepID=A0A0K0FVG9_STRVS